jgi:DNA uptake protein ComE-like DNA-binding protein
MAAAPRRHHLNSSKENPMRKTLMLKIGALMTVLFAFALPAVAQAPTLVNANTATEAQIATVPGLAPIAAQIVAKRPYASPTALDAALGAGNIPADTRKLLYQRIWVPMNLNTATPADIMLIPGMTPRMMNEFREYKPYRSIGQFRYEIGKYVSKQEVARLEAYVFVPAN